MAYAGRYGGSGLLPIVYVIVGAFVAGIHHYFTHLSTLASVVSGLLGIVLWPLVLLGINLHVHF